MFEVACPTHPQRREISRPYPNPFLILNSSFPIFGTVIATKFPVKLKKTIDYANR